MTKEEISRRILEAVKAVIEQVLEKELTEHLAAGYRERKLSQRGERSGRYTRSLITAVGKVEQLRVLREVHYGFAVSERREGTFLTEVFERYKRLTPQA